LINLNDPKFAWKLVKDEERKLELRLKLINLDNPEFAWTYERRNSDD
jgi:hypothetical protein